MKLAALLLLIHSSFSATPTKSLILEDPKDLSIPRTRLAQDLDLNEANMDEIDKETAPITDLPDTSKKQNPIVKPKDEFQFQEKKEPAKLRFCKVIYRRKFQFCIPRKEPCFCKVPVRK